MPLAYSSVSRPFSNSCRLCHTYISFVGSVKCKFLTIANDLNVYRKRIDRGNNATDSTAYFVNVEAFVPVSNRCFKCYGT